MRKYSFISNRVMKNSKGEETGKIQVFVLSGTETANVQYKCPECGFATKTEQPFRRPFSVKCSKCSFTLKLPKLKDAAKKEKKAARA